MTEVKVNLDWGVQVTIYPIDMKDGDLIKFRYNGDVFKKERPDCIDLPGAGVVENPSIKYCPKCKTDKPLAEFSKNIRDGRGVQSYCRLCMIEYNKKYITIIDKDFKDTKKNKDKKWTFEEEELLREVFYKHSIPELDKLFPGRSVKEIQVKAKLMGMKV